MMRRLVLAAMVAAAAGGAGAGTASAECDPKAKVCLEQCLVGLPDRYDPTPELFPPCPK